MKRFTSAERGALVAAAVLFVVGIFLVLRAPEVTVSHATNNVEGTSRGLVTERTSKAGSRMYGIVVLLFGAGFAAAGLCGRMGDPKG